MRTLRGYEGFTEFRNCVAPAIGAVTSQEEVQTVTEEVWNLLHEAGYTIVIEDHDLPCG